MNPKDLRASAPQSVNDDNTKYVHSTSTAIKTKSYHETEANSVGKMDATTVRPCAIIGPDRVQPQNTNDIYMKKALIDPWPCPENMYRQPPDYPNKLLDYQPNRNISPRQTFQENMQRIMVPPSYSSVKNSDEASLKCKKTNMPQEAKYCDVPYNMTSVTNELKSARNSDIPMSSVNPTLNRSTPHYGWPAEGSVRPQRPYGVPEFYQYPEFPSCVGPRSATMAHQHRIHSDEAQAYSERLYQEANIRFRPYPISKEKHQQGRYDYNIQNYPNTFNPPVSFPPHKFDLQKPIHNHTYPVYPQLPLKYLDRRVHENFVDGYQRSNQHANFNPSFHSQMIHPTYGPVSGNCVQNKPFSDLSSKSITVNKMPYDNTNKIYLDLDNSRNKSYPVPEISYYNDINQHMRNEILLSNHPTLNMHSIPKHRLYRRESVPVKHYEYGPHYRNLDPSINLNYSLTRLPLQYSPNSIAISPSDSNASNDTTHTLGTSQEDCGYASQSSTASVRSLDINNFSIQKDMLKRHDYRVHPGSRNISHMNGPELTFKNKTNSSSKKNIDVRQFLQMWNEGEEETNESNKEPLQIPQNHCNNPSETNNSQEQLYVLDLVNVPNEELSKYEHIQKISKLPENIKGYNSIEILNQYEELLESQNVNKYKGLPKFNKELYSLPKRSSEKENTRLARPLSPLDVEAKISQSVIHKEVGCNFEIKPCSPEMLNVEMATPIQSILGERIIEKVVNPISVKSPLLLRNDDNHVSDNNSCDVINKQYTDSNYPNIIRNNNYTVQDFESNSGLCLASLPRLDNDIELNFPEINQQFIKANQIEEKLTGDLPQLNENKINPSKNSFLNQNTPSPQHSLVTGPEKEVSKLSKYRKSKKYDLMPKEKNITAIAQQRIDSVIIKNPETIRLQDDMAYLNPNKSLKEGSNGYDTQHSPDEILNAAIEEKRILSFETAIDFSLGKIDEASSYKCINKNDKPNFGEDISFHSKDLIDKDINVDTEMLDLNIKQRNEEKTTEDLMNFELNTEPKLPNNELEENHVISFNLPENYSNEITNKSVGENISSFEHITQENFSSNEEIMPLVMKEEKEVFINNDLTVKEGMKCDVTMSPINNTSFETNLSFEIITNSIEQQNKIEKKVMENEPTLHEMLIKDDDDAKLDKNQVKCTNKNIENHKDIIAEEAGGKIFLEEFESINKIPDENENCKTNIHAVEEKRKIDESTTDSSFIKIIETSTQNKQIGVEEVDDGIEKDEEEIVSRTDAVNIKSETILEVEEIHFDRNIDGNETGVANKLHKKNCCEFNIKGNEVVYKNSQERDAKVIDDTIELGKNNIGDEILINPTKNCEFNIINESSDFISYQNREENEFETKLVEKEKHNVINRNVMKIVSDNEIDKKKIEDETKIVNEIINVNKRDNEIIIKECINYTDISNQEDNYSKNNKRHNLCKLSKNVPLIDYNKTESESGDKKPGYSLTNSENNLDDTHDNDLKYENKDIEVIKVHDGNNKSHKYETEMQFDKIDLKEPDNNESDTVNYTNDNHNIITTEQVTEEPLNICNMETNFLDDDFINDKKCNDKLQQPYAELSQFNKNEGKEILKTVEYCTKIMEKNYRFNTKIRNIETIINDNNIDKSEIEITLKQGTEEINTNKIQTSRAKNVSFKNKVYSPRIEKLVLFTEGICDKHSRSMEICQLKISTINKQLSEETLHHDRHEQHTISFTESYIDGTLKEPNNVQEIVEHCDDLPIDKLYSETNVENNTKSAIKRTPIIRRHGLKRSLSESALEDYDEDVNNKNVGTSKRKKGNHNIIQPIISEDLCNIIQSNRRNSISTLYNEENVYILIDNDFIITEENDDSDKIYYTEITDVCEPSLVENDSTTLEASSSLITESITDELNITSPTSSSLQEIEGLPQETWVDDVACIETVVSDDITDDVDEDVSATNCNIDTDSVVDQPVIYCDTKHLDKIKDMYGSNMCSNNTQILQTLYMTPQMNVNKTLNDIESHNPIEHQVDNNINNLIESDNFINKLENEILSYNNSEIINEKENINEEDTQYTNIMKNKYGIDKECCVSNEYVTDKEKEIIPSFNSDNNFCIQTPKKIDSNYSSSSSPEVSSTTSEEKNSSILLKITSYNGSRVSEVNNIGVDAIDTISYKLTEKNGYQNYNCNFRSSRTLITKAAQKYIPPLKETIGDLKIKLTLPQHRLRTLKQLKISKPKIEEKLTKCIDRKSKHDKPKKQKPKFEDVLKSIDEIQFKKHKDRIKKEKIVIPKVVIKKNENGAHYASSEATDCSNKDSYNPDLSGRKWQPWVFLEKNSFIDKMAVRNKLKAVYCHRKNNYVLAEKFRKYKSIYNANFVITQPSSNSSANGNLKYTIRLKHK